MRSILFAAQLGCMLASTAVGAQEYRVQKYTPLTAQEYSMIAKIDEACRNKYPEPSIVSKIFYGSRMPMERRYLIMSCVKHEMVKAKLSRFRISPSLNGRKP